MKASDLIKTLEGLIKAEGDFKMTFEDVSGESDSIPVAGVVIVGETFEIASSDGMDACDDDGDLDEEDELDTLDNDEEGEEE